MIELSYSPQPDTWSGVVSDNNPSCGLSERLYRAILAMIVERRLLPGQRVPAVRATAAGHGVSRDTVLRAYDKLVAIGAARAVRGSGFYVNEPEADDAPAPPGALQNQYGPLDPMRLLHSDHPLDHMPGSGVLRHEAGAQAEVARLVRGVVAGGPGLDGGYGDPLGYVPLRQQFRTQLHKAGVDCSIDQIVTVPGAVAGLGLAVRALLRPGNIALIEDPCSFIHITAMMAQGADIRRVPRLADGPDLAVLRALCERYRPPVFMLSSLLHNPTGTSIALHKAQALIEIAAEFDMALIDDCSYADLLPGIASQRTVPLVLLDRLRRVVHVGGYSRTVSPSLGAGYVVAGEAHIPFVRAYRPAAGIGNTLIAERSLYRMLSEGLYRRRCERIQTDLARRALALRQAIAAIGLPLPPMRDGMFLWMSLGKGVDATAIAHRMLARGYLTAPASHFISAPHVSSFMRFNVTTTTAEAVAALEACLRGVG